MGCLQATPQGVQGHPVPIWPPLANSTIACSVGWRAKIALLHGPAVHGWEKIGGAQWAGRICLALVLKFPHPVFRACLPPSAMFDLSMSDELEPPASVVSSMEEPPEPLSLLSLSLPSLLPLLSSPLLSLLLSLRDL